MSLAIPAAILPPPAPDKAGQPGCVCAHHGGNRPEGRDRSQLRLVLGHPGRQSAGSGLAQVILGLGRDELGLLRSELKPGLQIAEVFLDQVAGRSCRQPTTA
jgi:hypothetical protein